MMEQHIDVQGFDFSVVPEEKCERARELDAECGAAIQRLSYTVDEIGKICTEMKGILPHGSFIPWGKSRGLTYEQMKYAMRRVRERSQRAPEIEENPLFALPDPAHSTRDDEQAAKQVAEPQRDVRIAREIKKKSFMVNDLPAEVPVATAPSVIEDAPEVEDEPRVIAPPLADEEGRRRCDCCGSAEYSIGPDTEGARGLRIYGYLCYTCTWMLGSLFSGAGLSENLHKMRSMVTYIERTRFQNSGPGLNARAS